MLIANNKSVKKKCQLAWDLNSDRYYRSQTTDLNNSPTRYHPNTAITAFVVYNSACRPNLPQSVLRGGRGVRAVGVATLNANSVIKERINAKSRPNVVDWQYLGVDKFTRWLEWNCGRTARKGHICEDTFAYGSYSSKDVVAFGAYVAGYTMLTPSNQLIKSNNVYVYTAYFETIQADWFRGVYSVNKLFLLKPSSENYNYLFRKSNIQKMRFHVNSKPSGSCCVLSPYGSA